MRSVIPYDMDGGGDGPTYFDPLMESLSDLPSVDTVVNPAHDAETLFSQGQPFIDEELINSWLFGIPRYTYNLDVDAEVGSVVRAGARLGDQLLNTDIQTHLLELQRHRDDFAVVHPSYHVGKTMTDLVWVISLFIQAL
jgi:hypothetical protein